MQTIVNAILLFLPFIVVALLVITFAAGLAIAIRSRRVIGPVLIIGSVVITCALIVFIPLLG